MSKEQLNNELFDAITKGELSIITSLLQKGAEVNAKNESGMTPLHLAANWGHQEVVKFLINKGANFNAKNENGFTPLHEAVLYGQKDIAELLIKKGADLNAKNKNGKTPLHRTALSGQKEIAELLIKEGADLNAKDKAGETALDIAQEKRYKDIVDLLQQAESRKISTYQTTVQQPSIDTKQQNNNEIDKQRFELEKLRLQNEFEIQKMQLQLKIEEKRAEAELNSKDKKIRKKEKKHKDKKHSGYAIRPTAASYQPDDIMMPDSSLSGNESLVVMPKEQSFADKVVGQPSNNSTHVQQLEKESSHKKDKGNSLLK